MNKKIKVLYLITRLDAGGAQKSVAHTAQHLPRKDFETFIAAGPGGPLESAAKSRFKERFFVIKSLRHKVSLGNLPYDFIAIFSIIFLIMRVRPHIIHTNCPKAGAVGRAAALLFRPKIKVVHTYHGLGFSVYNGIKRYLLYAYIERLLSYVTDRLIFVSKANKTEAESLNLRIGNAKKNLLIYAGAEFESLKPSFDKERKLASLGIKPGTKVVLSIGNFKPLKNARDFVYVAAAVNNKLPGTHFLYVGFGGEQESRTKTLAKKLGFKKNLSFLGLRHDIRELFEVSDLYVSTSLREGLPLALLESFACAVPAVAYEADGISEVLVNNKNGFLIGQNRKEEMARCITDIFSDPALYNKLKQGAQSFDTKPFSAQITVNKLSALYKSIL